ncbi:MAG: hypothetical protein ACM3KF_04620 [Acidobacteriota bacterium]
MEHNDLLMTRVEKGIIWIRTGFNWRPYEFLVPPDLQDDPKPWLRPVKMQDNTPMAVTVDGRWQAVTLIG